MEILYHISCPETQPDSKLRLTRIFSHTISRPHATTAVIRFTPNNEALEISASLRTEISRDPNNFNTLVHTKLATRKPLWPTDCYAAVLVTSSLHQQDYLKPKCDQWLRRGHGSWRSAFSLVFILTPFTFSRRSSFVPLSVLFQI